MNVTPELIAMADALCQADCNHDRGPNGCRECLLDYTAGASTVRLNCTERWGDHARSGLMAIREPSESMCQALADSGFVYHPYRACAHDAIEVVVDYILGEPAQPSPPSEARSRVTPSMQVETGEFAAPKDGQT